MYTRFVILAIPLLFAFSAAAQTLPSISQPDIDLIDTIDPEIEGEFTFPFEIVSNTLITEARFTLGLIGLFENVNESSGIYASITGTPSSACSAYYREDWFTSPQEEVPMPLPIFKHIVSNDEIEAKSPLLISGFMFQTDGDPCLLEPGTYTFSLSSNFPYSANEQKAYTDTGGDVYVEFAGVSGFDTESPAPEFDTQSSYIIDVNPKGGGVLASTTPVFFDWLIHVAEKDWDDDLKFVMELWLVNNPSCVFDPFAGGGFLDENECDTNYITFEWDLEGDAFGIHSDFITDINDQLIEGRTRIHSYIYNPWDFFGFLSGKVLDSRDDYFIYEYLTNADTLVEQREESQAWLNETASSTAQQVFENCSPGLSFDFKVCFVSLLWPNNEDMNYFLSLIKGNILNRVPFGYLNRFFEILNSEETEELPDIAWTFKDTAPFPGEFRFPISEYLEEASDMINEDFVSGIGLIETEESENLWDIFMPPLTILGYLFLVLKIISEISGLDFKRTATQDKRVDGSTPDETYRYKEKLWQMSQRKKK